MPEGKFKKYLLQISLWLVRQMNFIFACEKSTTPYDNFGGKLDDPDQPSTTREIPGSSLKTHGHQRVLLQHPRHPQPNFNVDNGRPLLLKWSKIIVFFEGRREHPVCPTLSWGAGGVFTFALYSTVESIYLLCLVVSRLKSELLDSREYRLFDQTLAE